jgi:hypothetical protein
MITPSTDVLICTPERLAIHYEASESALIETK